MNKHVGREALLLALSAAPILISFFVLSIDAEWARRFIKVQLVGMSLSSWLTFGLAPTLSALSLASTLRPPHWLLLIGSFACPVAAAIMWLSVHLDLTDAALIASLTTIAVLYRLPAMRIMGRLILLAQFLLIAGEPGRLIVALIVGAALAHLTYLGAFRRGEEDGIRPVTVGQAYLVSVVKDFFYRGHYLLLSSFGLAGQQYATILRLLDISSRPTDYLFQRLVDEDRISSRLRYVLALVPASAGITGILLTVLPSFSWASMSVIILICLSNGLIVLTKYLAYEQNAKLRFMSMTTIYAAAATLAFPVAFVPFKKGLPLLYFLAALSILTLTLLTFQQRVARGSS